MTNTQIDLTALGIEAANAAIESGERFNAQQAWIFAHDLLRFDDSVSDTDIYALPTIREWPPAEFFMAYRNRLKEFKSQA